MAARPRGARTPLGRDQLPAAQRALIDTFVDALWLEDGLAANSLAAYRRDLESATRHLGETPLLAATEPELAAWFAAAHQTTRPATANRRLAVLRRFYRWALREGR